MIAHRLIHSASQEENTNAFVSFRSLYGNNIANVLFAINIALIHLVTLSLPSWKANGLLQFSHQLNQVLNGFLLVFAFCCQGNNRALSQTQSL